MNKYFYLVLFFITLFLSGSNVHGQSEVNTEKLFHKLATTVSRNSSEVAIRNYSSKIARIVGESREPEITAATLLLELQGNKPADLIATIDTRTYTPYRTSGKFRIELTTNLLLIWYLKVLFICSRDKNDPISKILNDQSLPNRVDQHLKNYDLTSLNAEDKIADLIIRTKKEADRIGIGNVPNSNELRLFFPLCLLTKGGC